MQTNVYAYSEKQNSSTVMRDQVFHIPAAISSFQAGTNKNDASICSLPYVVSFVSTW